MFERFTEKRATEKNGNRKIGQGENSATKIEMVGKKGNTKLLSELRNNENGKDNGKTAAGKMGSCPFSYHLNFRCRIFSLPIFPLPFFCCRYFTH